VRFELVEYLAPILALRSSIANRARKLLIEIHGSLDSAARYDRFARLNLRYREVGEGPAEVTGMASQDLTPFEYSVFSQNGEDGVICELLRRIGEGNGWFVEFGIETGVEGNCVFLAEARGWSGLFMEGADSYDALAHRWSGRTAVSTVKAIVGPDNINDLLDAEEIPDEPTVISIDIDGNDYYVWRALERRPRLLIVEYNASLPLDSDERLVQPRADGVGLFEGTNFFGASLGALEALGAEKGYRLVHTDLAGVNAFFVRDDLLDSMPVGDAVPRRAANYFLMGRSHPPDPRGLSAYLRL
jgi:hypothetical protein